MATGGAYATSSSAGIKRAYASIPTPRQFKSKTLKQIKADMGLINKRTLKQRFRDWLLETDYSEEVADQGIYVEEDKLSSDGMRLQIYKASGGYVVETRSYDRRTDRNNNTMHVVTEDQDLGEALGKIVMMEALRG